MSLWPFKTKGWLLLLALAGLGVGGWRLVQQGSGGEGLGVGQRPPEFRLVDAYGRTVTRDSLVGDRPGLILFTATWCLPCVEGLRDLVRYQREAGVPVRVLLVFVDPNETEADLRAFRERYGFPEDWFYALDREEMAFRYRVRYLDTKFLLDEKGVIRYTDFRPADYATWKRAFSQLPLRPR